MHNDPELAILRQLHDAGEVQPGRITIALDMASLYGPEVDVALGVEEPAVDEWEAGTRYPTFVQMLRLAALTGYPLGFFYRPQLVALGPAIMCSRTRRKNGCQYIPAQPAPEPYDLDVVRATVGSDA